MRQERRAQTFEIEFQYAQPTLLAPDDNRQHDDRNDRDERSRILKKHCLPPLLQRLCLLTGLNSRQRYCCNGLVHQ